MTEAALTKRVGKLEERLLKAWEAIHNLERQIKLVETPRLTDQAIDKPTPESAALWDELRQWRKRTAEDEGRKPYNIFADRALAGIVANLPMDRYELQQIKGIGELCIERYADDILAIVQRHVTATGGEW